MLNIRAIDLNLLPVFEAVYEERNMTRAADRLAMTQPAVSNAVARLRSAIGDPLFVPGRRGAVVTPAADELYPRVKQALDAVRDGFATTRRFDPAQSTRRFALGTLYAPGIGYWQRMADWARREAPLLSWKIVSEHQRDLALAGLRAARIDLLFDYLAPQTHDLDSVALFEDELVVVVARNHPRIGTTITRSQFLRERHVVHASLRSPGNIAFLEGAVGYRALDIALEAREPFEIPIAVAGTDYIAACNRRLAEPWSKLLGLRILPLPFRAVPLHCYLVWHQSRQRDAGHRWVRDRLARLAAKARA
jgi:LysR family transcriptional activator for leuABCD operon